MESLNIDEKFIVEKLNESGKTMNYRKLQNLCEDKFEGVRLVLKKLKEKGIVDYEGVIPAFNSDIKLLR